MELKEIKQQVEKEILTAKMNIKYHKWRIDYFDNIDKIIKIVITFFSCSALVSYGIWKLSYTTELIWASLSIIIALLGIYSVISPPCKGIIKHSELQTKYISVLTTLQWMLFDINNNSAEKEDIFRKYKNQILVMNEIKAKEPKPKRRLLVKAQKEVRIEAGLKKKN